MTNPLNFQMVSNNDFLLEWVVTKKSDGSLFDLTGCSLIWQLFAPCSRNPIVTYSTSDGSIVIEDQGAAKGRFRFQIEHADVQDLDTDYYPHEAVLVDSSGNDTTLIADIPELPYGTAFIRRQLTNQGA